MSADLIKYTEAAMALLEGKIADVIYLPPDIRRNKLRINAAGHATTKPPSDKEALDRIAAADPLGFLLAVMNGQPVVTFAPKAKEVEPKKTSAKTAKAFPLLSLGKVNGVEIVAEFHVPSIDDRKEVAKFLTPFVTERKRKTKGEEKPDEEQDEFERILAQRRQQAKEESDGSAEG
jgi:hypothetical protein